MQLTNAPAKLVLPFANAGAKNTIPTASQIGITNGAASLTDGFPPLTRTPLAAGGTPPSGLDMNGILYGLSAVIRWANAGGGYPFDGTFANDTNVGGYPKGARVLRSDGLGYWFNTVDANVTDPESAGAVAAGWVPDFTSGATAVTMTNANVTLTGLQYGKPIIVITGTLTANLNLIFPNIAKDWIVINNTTGGYTVTCKTAAGTGVVVTLTQTIVGDGTNIYLAAAVSNLTNAGAFYKVDSTTPVFTKTGAGTATIKAGTIVTVAGLLQTFATDTNITMPTLTAGTDYAIYVCTDGTCRADSSFSAPSGYTTANSRKIGGFHYAPGGNATAQSGGDTTPAINQYSLWDLKFRPTASDPRGMTLVAGGFWMDIYLTGVDAITNGSSKYNVLMGDGASPPKVPTMFGGNGTATYGSYNWWQAMELATAFGKRCPTQQEFMSAAYGTTEASSIGTDQNNTILNAVYTSKWGVIQATGVLQIWGRERGGAYATGGWNPATGTTASRGSEYNAPNTVILGGNWGYGSNSGSRYSNWNTAASVSDSGIGSRFACDHLQLD